MGKFDKEQVFSYQSQEQLKLLVGLLSENSIEASLGLKAVVPEDFDTLHNLISKYSGNYSKELVPTLRHAADRLLAIATEQKVLPFDTLRFKFYFGSKPDVEHHGHALWRELELERFEHPRAFTEGWRYFSIRMDEARNPEHIRMIKETAASLDTTKYHITSLSAGLNPQDWQHEYAGGTDFDGRLWAGGGEVTITGMKTTDKQKEGTPHLLEHLLKIGMTPVPQGLPAPRTA